MKRPPGKGTEHRWSAPPPSGCRSQAPSPCAPHPAQQGPSLQRQLISTSALGEGRGVPTALPPGPWAHTAAGPRPGARTPDHCPPPTARRVWAGRGALPSPTPPRLRGSPPHPRTISTTLTDPVLPSFEMTMGDWHGHGPRPARGGPGPARHKAQPRAKLPRKASVTDAVSQTTPLLPSGCRHVSRPAPAPAQPPLYAPAPVPCTPTLHSPGPTGKKPASTDQPVLCTHRPRPAPRTPGLLGAAALRVGCGALAPEAPGGAPLVPPCRSRRSE